MSDFKWLEQQIEKHAKAAAALAIPTTRNVVIDTPELQEVPHKIYFVDFKLKKLLRIEEVV